MDFALLSIEMIGSFDLLWAKALKSHEKRGYKCSLEKKKNYSNTRY